MNGTIEVLEKLADDLEGAWTRRPHSSDRTAWDSGYDTCAHDALAAIRCAAQKLRASGAKSL